MKNSKHSFHNYPYKGLATLYGLVFSLATLSQASQAVTTSGTESSVSVTFGTFISHQVNVDGNGQNILGDKGNEPTLALNPLNPANIVIGWRKFDSPPNAIKHGGYAYSFDGGLSWNGGQLAALPGQSRTDPAVDADAKGNFYYQSLALGGEDRTSVFKSSDGGMTWSEPVFQFHGDKNWLAIDKTGGAGDGNIYSTWRRTSFPNPDPNYVPKYFIRSTGGGKSYQEPATALPAENFGFGRIAIGAEGEVYLSGVDESIQSVNSLGIIRAGHVFMKSVNAMNANSSPTFSAKKVDLGGDSMLLLSDTLQLPNPLGGDGDVQIAADQSNSGTRGNIYMLAQVTPYNWIAGNNPQDIHFIRSSDGGETWSTAIRINDDSLNAHTFHWFPMLSVARNSRIDAVWYDTRNGTGVAPFRHSQLFYAYSWDAGLTWSQNQAVTPQFDTHLPNSIVNGKTAPNDKIGDYTQMISTADAAHIAYAATFNGEQDVYYLKVFPDCNHNARSDVEDIQQRFSGDTNSNHLPDSCEAINVIGDIDGDRDVDQHDLNLLLNAKNQPVLGTNDPRDLDDNGLINLLDARKLALLCTRTRCAI